LVALIVECVRAVACVACGADSVARDHPLFHPYTRRDPCRCTTEQYVDTCCSSCWIAWNASRMFLRPSRRTWMRFHPAVVGATTSRLGERPSTCVSTTRIAPACAGDGPKPGVHGLQEVGSQAARAGSTALITNKLMAVRRRSHRLFHAGPLLRGGRVLQRCHLALSMDCTFRSMRSGGGCRRRLAGTDQCIDEARLARLHLATTAICNGVAGDDTTDVVAGSGVAAAPRGDSCTHQFGPQRSGLLSSDGCSNSIKYLPSCSTKTRYRLTMPSFFSCPSRTDPTFHRPRPVTVHSRDATATDAA